MNKAPELVDRDGTLPWRADESMRIHVLVSEAMTEHEGTATEPAGRWGMAYYMQFKQAEGRPRGEGYWDNHTPVGGITKEIRFWDPWQSEAGGYEGGAGAELKLIYSRSACRWEICDEPCDYPPPEEE